MSEYPNHCRFSMTHLVSIRVLPAGTSVANLISSSKSNKARLLHYYRKSRNLPALGSIQEPSHQIARSHRTPCAGHTWTTP